MCEQPLLSLSPEMRAEDPSEQENGASEPIAAAEPAQLDHGRRLSALRASLAIVAGKAAGLLSRRLHLGGGTSIAGIVAQRIYPQIVQHLAGQLEHGNIVITGTNGKTTTSGFVAAILRNSGLRVWHNREGSNLLGGVASLFVGRAQPNGRLHRLGNAISVLEIDEATVPHIVQALEPRVIVFTNLFRDQLDRYGEVESIVSRWQEAIQSLPKSTILVLNADDPSIAHLGDGFPGKVLYYGVDDASLDLQRQLAAHHQVSDACACVNCGHRYTYHLRFYSHIGHYHCSNCGLQRPQPDVRVTRVEAAGFDSYRLTIEDTLANDGESARAGREVVVPLPGLYNVYNALAAIVATSAINTDWQAIAGGIEQFKPAFGRGELIAAEGKMIRLLLAKNPTGFNEVLRTLFSDGIARHVLFILNDNIADGQDVSWIWDVDFERAAGHTQTLVISGTRALDLALRLKYANISEREMTIMPQMTEMNSCLIEGYGLKRALDTALQQTPLGETLFVVPTYTGLLAIRQELTQRGLTLHYWEGGETR